MRLVAALAVAAAASDSGQDAAERAEYMRARKDGGWDAHCEAAYESLGSGRYAGLGAGVARSGLGVVFSAAGDAEFARREVVPAAGVVAGLRAAAGWPAGARAALFAERGLLARSALGSPAGGVRRGGRYAFGDGGRFLGAFDVVAVYEDEVAAAGASVPSSPRAFRVKAAKIVAMARSPFAVTVYLDFDSKPCAPTFAATVAGFLGDGGDVALADNYAGQAGLPAAAHYGREHASGCVALRSTSPRTQAFLEEYLEAFVALRSTPRGRRDQPALMVALKRRSHDLRDLVDLPIPPDVFCRKNTSAAVSCDACVVAHKSAKYDVGFKVFGVGFKKTGTTSLAAALRELKIGPEPDHARAVAATVALLRPDADAAPAVALARTSRAFADAPWCMAGSRGGLLRRLATAYPRAKFVLTVRDPETWWTSINNWLTCLKPFNQPRYAAMLNASAFTRDAFVQAYVAYNANVKRYFAETDPTRLLVVDLSAKAGDGAAFPWADLCAFVEAWGKCPKETSLRANAYLENDFSAKHPDEAPGAAALAKCAAAMGDDARAPPRGVAVDATSRLAMRRARRDRGAS